MFVTVGVFHYESKLFPSLVSENRIHRTIGWNSACQAYCSIRRKG